MHKGIEEIEISQMLSSNGRLEDPMNHCVPIYDFIQGSPNDTYDFLVMPLLREFDDPPFYAVEEVVDFVRQTLEVRLPLLRLCDLSMHRVL